MKMEQQRLLKLEMLPQLDSRNRVGDRERRSQRQHCLLKLVLQGRMKLEIQPLLKLGMLRRRGSRDRLGGLER